MTDWPSSPFTFMKVDCDLWIGHRVACDSSFGIGFPSRKKLLAKTKEVVIRIHSDSGPSISVQEGLSPNDSRDLHIASSGRRKSRIGANLRVFHIEPLYHTRLS